MKKSFALILILALLLGPHAVEGPVLGMGQPPDASLLADHQLAAPHAPDELIVRFRPGLPAQARAAVFSQHGLAEKEDLFNHLTNAPYVEKLVKIPSGRSPAEFLEVLNRDPRVEFAEPNYIYTLDATPNDPRFDELWALRNTGQTGGTPGADISAVDAWDITTGSEEIIVGVIDTGVDYTHEDLAANMWVNPGETANGNDDDGNGWVDDIHGINAITGTGDPLDDEGHGTHVAGTIGAVGNNAVGVVGVNWTVRIAACKFLSDEGVGFSSDAVKCFKYFNHLKHVLGHNILITNNSWGGTGFNQALKDAMAGLDQPGMTPILHVAAAGNNSGNNDVNPRFPAAFNLDNIIAVAASDHDDAYATFSNHGANSVHLAAPGVDILSTVPTGSCALCDPSGYRLLSGTSMAAPHVAGAAALLWADDPTLSFMQVKGRLMFQSDPITGAVKSTVSDGRLNALKALTVDDDIPPAPVTDLAVSGSTLGTITLTWTATGDDGTEGTASLYDVRFSTSPISEENWDAATRAFGEPKPQPSGSNEVFTVSGLAPDTTYFFAMKVMDDAGNLSDLSNVADGTTQAGVVLFEDDMENGVNGWTTTGSGNLWHQNTHRSNSPDTAWFFGVDGQFTMEGAACGFGRLHSPDININDATDVILVFYEWNNLRPGANATVGIQTDQMSFPLTVFVSSETSGQWHQRVVDISDFVGQGNASIKFDFQNCGCFETCDLNYEGWHIDDVKIIVGQEAGEPTPPTITSSPVTEAVVGEPYSYQAEASGTAPINWSLLLGPDGMAINADTGLVTWTPDTIGAFNVEIQAANDAGSDTQPYSITVSDAPEPTPTPTPEPADTVEITRAEYRESKQELHVRATSTGAPSAVLQVFVTATDELIGALDHTGGNEYRKTFNWPVNPENITVKSSQGGSDSSNVDLK